MKTLLNKMTIKAKLILLVTINMLFFIVASGYAVLQMKSIGEEIVGIAERDLPLIDIVSKATVHQIEMEVLFERAGRFGALIGREESAQQHFDKTVAEFRRLSESLNNEILTAEARAEAAQVQSHRDNEKAEFGKILEELKQTESNIFHFEQQSMDVFAALQSGDVHGVELKLEKVEHFADEISHSLQTILLEVEQFTHQAALTAEHHEQSALNVLMTLIVVALAVAMLIATLIISNIRDCLQTAMVAMDRMAAGDFSKSVETSNRDEIGQMLHGLEDMRKGLIDVVTEINRSADTMSAASEELAAASEETSQSVHQQKNETEQLAAAMNEMAATVQQVAASTTSAAESAGFAHKDAQQGLEVVEDTISTINALARGFEDSAKAISKVGEESENIGIVLDVIRGVAEQTNLLALNAAIEAARAGEQGRGFAVVADEVRVLATRTNESTQEIQAMIERLQGDARQSVDIMDESSRQMGDSVSKAKQAGDVLKGVMESVANISEMSSQIATAAEQQSSVTEELNQNISSISLISEQNAACSNQTAQASCELAETASGLKEMIQRFKLA